MSLKRTMEESAFHKLEPGTYSVTCMEVREDTLENAMFGSGDVIRFVLRFDDVMDADGNEVTRDAIANDKLSPLSKLTQWLRAFGVEASVGTEIDLEECIGRKALAVIEEREKDGMTYDRIADIKPPIRTAKAKEPAAMTLSEWWAATRTLTNGTTGKPYEPEEVIEAARQIFDKHPKDMSGQERSDLIAAL